MRIYQLLPSHDERRFFGVCIRTWWLIIVLFDGVAAVRICTLSWLNSRYTRKWIKNKRPEYTYGQLLLNNIIYVRLSARVRSRDAVSTKFLRVNARSFAAPD